MYIPLNITTDYSILSSLIKIDDLIKFALKNNYKALGICDDNLCYAIEFYNKCKINNIKPIIGLKVNIDNKNIYLYAKNYKGYQNLCYISSNNKDINLINNNSNDLFIVFDDTSIDLYDKINIKNKYVNITNKNNYKYKYIYFNEIKCLTKEDNEYLKYLYLIKNNQTINDNNYIDRELYFKNDIELSKDILDNFNEIYNFTDIEIIKNDLQARFDDDKDFDEYKYLKSLAIKGLKLRFNNKVPVKYAKRLLYELDTINNMGFSNYFLVVYDYVKFAKKNNILVGPGRGSAAGSLVSYAIGITDVDPIKYDLYFERFLNPERVTMPDIDVDFASDRKDEVIDYVKKKYGEKRAVGIITYGTLKAKMAIRDVSRIFDSENKIDSFIKLFDSNLTIEENINNNSIKNIIMHDTLISRIISISLKLEGLKRTRSMHAAGIIIANKDLDRYIPLIKNDNEYISGYTMNYLEELGILKMDFLSLDNLVLIDNIQKEAKIDIKNIRLDDEKTLDIFRNIDTDGIFQFETNGIKNTLRKFKIDSFNDLAVILALFRPGPMENIDLYINRKEGKEKINYIHKDLEPILKDTYGIIIYQEQIMQIAVKMASFSLGEADILRRAMSKKNNKLMMREKEKFINGAIKNGYSKEISNEVFNYIYKFSSYGFNKSHSICYALISYKMAYLKAHYRIYFMKYLLNINIGNIFKTKKYINECKINNINILKPDINKSNSEYIIENNSIRYALSNIKNVGSLTSNIIIKERKNGLYKDFIDFNIRAYKIGIDKKTIKYLIYSSSFISFNYNIKTLIQNLNKIYDNYASIYVDSLERPLIKKYEEYNKDELIKLEYDTFGFYLSNHPVQKYRINNIYTKNIKEYFNKNIDIYLLIDNKREVVTKNQEKMLFINAEDEFGEVNLVVFPKIYEKNYDISINDIFLVNAKVERRNSNYQLIVNKMNKLN